MNTQISRRTGSCEFDPPESFPEDVIRYHGVPPDSDTFSTPPDRPLFHADMDPDMLQSYLTWRRAVAERRNAAPH